MKKNLLLAGMLILAGFILVPNFSEASTYDADTNTIHATPYSGNYTDH
ncbi:MAG: hypothetical protein LBO09_00515 [Candidatus Peribacteria bacterium]|jgi:hypothetical protein|nr:hypothetical protein [Candidatus Peribacteria bacterium]